MGGPAIGALGVLALALGTLQTVVDPARPMLERELGIDSAGAALIVSTLLITGAIVAPIAGKLGDRYGGKRVLLVLMALVSAGGAVSSLAPNLPVLLVGQMLQGAMVGALPLSFILVRKHLPPGQTQVAIGVVSALFTAGGAIGTLIAGPLAEGLSWNWIFAAPTIVIVAATAVVSRLMPNDPPSEQDTAIDWLGVALLSATLLALMLGLLMVTDGSMPPLAVGGVVAVVAALAAAWVAVERRAVSPMVELRMLAAPAMWSASVLTVAIAAISAMLQTVIPKMFGVAGDGYGFGLSTTEIGLLMMPATIAGVVAGSVGGLAVQRYGARVVVTASVVVTAGALLALALLHDASWQLVVVRALAAFAGSLATTALLASTAVAVAAADTGIATSLLVVVRLVGAVLGGQIAGSVLAAGIDPASGEPAESAFVTGFVVAGLVAVLSLLVVRHLKKGAEA
ncbi:Major Facilitator Superfamily protein [Promicromonospora umidemergens]|uniref:MFS transporter n=1 Tax=Promicromonospora umidemergens TaxID=629679 RepID=A0ABP8Y7P7_9MICO|nr:MFS transporter [Promicromonospora umidemergens]MCP2282397.1 Major Facilitator Superfamily protein [Promicromonospora umidemergens]